MRGREFGIATGGPADPDDNMGNEGGRPRQDGRVPQRRSARILLPIG